MRTVSGGMLSYQVSLFISHVRAHSHANYNSVMRGQPHTEPPRHTPILSVLHGGAQSYYYLQNVITTKRTMLEQCPWFPDSRLSLY